MFDSRVAMPLWASDVPPLSCNDVESLSCDSGSSAISAIHICHAVPEQYLSVSLYGRMCWAYWRSLTRCACRLAKAKVSCWNGSKRLSAPAAMGSHGSTSHIHGPSRRLHESGLVLEKAAVTEVLLEGLAPHRRPVLTLLQADWGNEGQDHQTPEKTGRAREEISQHHETLAAEQATGESYLSDSRDPLQGQREPGALGLVGPMWERAVPADQAAEDDSLPIKPVLLKINK